MSRRRSHCESIRHAHPQSKKARLLIGAGLIYCLASSIFLLLIVRRPHYAVHTAHHSYIEKVTNDQAFEAQVLTVAARFYCGCNNCREIALAMCDCYFARQERDFIRQRLQEGKTVDLVAADVAFKYDSLIENAAHGITLNN